MGAGCSGTDACRPQPSMAVAADFVREAWKLTVKREGPGNVTVSYAGATKLCAEVCELLVPVGFVAVVSGAADSGARLIVFEGDCVSNGTTCDAQSDKERSVVVRFEAERLARLNLTIGGGGEGTVESDPTGIRCFNDGGSCSALFAKGSTVRLVANPSAGSVVGAWGGQLCSGPDCFVAMATDESASLTFLETRRLQIQLSGNSIGKVEINGVQQDLPYIGRLPRNTAIKLRAAPSPDDTSLGFSGLPCQETHPLTKCTFSLADDATGEMRVQRLIQWVIGGWSGYLSVDAMQPGATGNVVVLASFGGSSSFTSPPMISAIGDDPAALKLIHLGGVKLIHPKLNNQTTAS